MATAARKTNTERIVHAYRRIPHLVGEPPVEKAVEVIACGEKILFKSNDEGHVVATVKSSEAYDRLVKEIPEAYIEYQGGTNIPERKSDIPQRPVGAYVLTNDEETVVLDDMTDEELRQFAAKVGIEAEALPDVLKGDTLKLAIFNTLNTGV